MQVLVALARRAEEVVSRDELVTLCWAGRIVGEDAIQRAVAKVRHLGEGSGAFAIETIPRVGYRLIPVEPHTATRVDHSPQFPHVEIDSIEPSTEQVPAAVVLTKSPPDVSQATLAVTQLPSICVLPFLNLTGGADRECFVDGMTEDIITALSRFREIRTVPRGPAFVFKGKPFDLQEIAQRFGVQYVLTGTVRMARERVRVSAELVNSENCAQVLRSSFDRELTNIFDLQDELSRNIAAVLVPALQNAEVERAEHKPAGDLSAHDLYLRALPHMWAGTKDDILEAIASLRRSLQLEVAASTLSALAFSLLTAPPLGAASPEETLSEAVQTARRAIELDAEDAFAQATYGLALAFDSADRGQIVLHTEEAVRLNPSSAFAWGCLGAARNLTGDFERGLESLELAIRLSPSDASLYLWLTFQAVAHFALERYAEGVSAARQAVLHNPNFGTAHRLLAANLALLGRIAEALAVTRTRDGVQRTSLKELSKMRLFQQVSIMERYLAGQRLCGVDD